MGQRKQFTAGFKAKVAVEAIKGQRTAQEIGSIYGVHPTQVTTWKRQLVAQASEIFTRAGIHDNDAIEQEKGGALSANRKVADGIGLASKKVRDLTTLSQRRESIEANHRRLSIARQCELIALPRSSWYYKLQEETAENLLLMRLLDEQYTRTPFYGSRRMVIALGEQGWKVNRKRVQRLMPQMGIEAIYPKPRLSDPAPGHRIYPYRLRGMVITRPNQVWSTDITYIRMRNGFVYLVSILDWFSRYVVDWEVSITLDTSFCLSTLDRALEKAKPEIFNSDQGSQFTSAEFTRRLEDARVLISMDGRGRALDNIFTERLWRTVKYEEVYLKDYTGVLDAIGNLKAYFRFYNRQRPNQALNYQTPEAVYFGVNATKTAMLRIGLAADRRLSAILARRFSVTRGSSERMPLRGGIS